MKKIILTIIIVWSTFSLIKSGLWLANQKDAGGFMSREWKDPALADFVKSVGQEHPVYSNASDGIYFITGVETQHFPRIKFDADRKSNEYLDQDLKHLSEDLKNNAGYVVYFPSTSWRDYLISEEELKQRLDLQLVKETTYARIYKLKN